MSVSDILKKNRFVITVNGSEYEVRKVQGYMALDAMGADAMAMLSEGGEQTPWEKQNYKKQIAYMKSYMKIAMVSPALGDKTDADNDIICAEDMGDDFSSLFGELMDSIETDAEVFPESSEVLEE